MTRVAVGQTRIDLDDAATTLRTASSAVREAAAAGAELVVLPELADSGYAYASRAEALGRSDTVDGETVRGWAGLSAELGLVLVAGFCERDADGGGPYTSAVVLDRGRRVAVYRKTHLWANEKSIFVSGDAPAPVVDTSVGRIGVLICYDLEFPELARDCARRGAQLLAVPANWPTVPVPSGERPIEVIKAQAAAAVNRVVVAVADRCGAERGVDWFGASLICGVEGFPVAGPATGKPVVLTADVDLAAADDKALGPANDVLADFRPEVVLGWGTLER